LKRRKGLVSGISDVAVAASEQLDLLSQKLQQLVTRNVRDRISWKRRASEGVDYGSLMTDSSTLLVQTTKELCVPLQLLLTEPVPIR
jgi:hypothetical protein